MDSPLSLIPRQCGLEGVKSVKKVVGGRQRALVDQILGRRDGTLVEGGDPSRERVDKTIQFRFWKRSVDISISLRGIAIEILRSKNDFERAATTNQMRQTFSAAAARVQSYPDFRLAQERVFSRCKSHVASEHKLTAHASDAASDLRDAGHWRSGETDKRIRQN